MLRPNRIGPWPLGDIETPPWDPGATLLANIDDNAPPTIAGGVRSITVPEITNCETIYWHRQLSPTQKHSWALGLLIDGVNQTSTNNIIYAVTGSINLINSTSNVNDVIFPLMSKLDATPSVQTDAITITDYSMLPCDTYMQLDKTMQASVNTQIIVGDMRGSTSSQSDLPIFVGWAYHSHLTTAYTVAMHASLSVYKYVVDIQTEDPWR